MIPGEPELWRSCGKAVEFCKLSNDRVTRCYSVGACCCTRRGGPQCTELCV